MKPLRLNPREIDVAVAALRRGGEWVHRGRGGDGLGCKDGVFYSISVEEFDRQDSPFADEAQLRRYLGDVDVGDYSNRYITSVLEELGAFASYDVEDAEARAAALAQQKKVAMTGPWRWSGVVGAVTRRADGGAFVELGGGMYASVDEEVERELAAEGATLLGWQGRALEVRAHLEEDTPSVGCAALRVTSRIGLRLLS